VIELSHHKRTLAKLFALTPTYTLDDALMQTQAPADCIQVTASGLCVMTGDSRRAADTHQQLRRVLKEVEGMFDVVLVDAPPVLKQADALIVASIIRTVILVVESGRTSYDVLDSVKSELANEDIRIAGTVLLKCKRFVPRWMHGWSPR